MATNNPYQALVEGFARLLSQGEALSPAGLIPPKRPPVAANAPTALIFAPHPEDEVIIGGLPSTADAVRQNLRYFLERPPGRNLDLKLANRGSAQR